MKKTELREKIIEYLHSKGHGVPEAYRGDATAILSIVREAVSAVKPKIEHSIRCAERLLNRESDYCICGADDKNKANADYHDAILEVLK